MDTSTLVPSMSMSMSASASATATTTMASLLPSATPDVDAVPAHRANPVVAFIIGVAIVTLASVLNAAGLNLTKLDHVRGSLLPVMLWR